MIALTEEIIQGRRLGKEESVQTFLDADLKELCEGANRIRKALCGSKVDLCSIINGRSGRCGEILFCAGANATLTGDMLTTVGNSTKQDRDMLKKLGFEMKEGVKKYEYC